eukprot:10407783-Lingulodinium_polyedra.AAC.1
MKTCMLSPGRLPKRATFSQQPSLELACPCHQGLGQRPGLRAEEQARWHRRCVASHALGEAEPRGAQGGVRVEEGHGLRDAVLEGCAAVATGCQHRAQQTQL